MLVKLGLDHANYVKGLSEAESKTKSATGNLGKHFDAASGHVSKFGGIMSGIGAGIGMAGFNLAVEGIGKVTDFLEDSEKAYQESIVSQAKLSTALKNNVPGWDGNTDAIEKLMEARMRLGFDDEDQRDSMALLLGATKDVSKAEAAQAAAMDLARLKGISLADATSTITSAMGGRTAGLKKLGIEVEKGATQEQILAAVLKVAGGQAEAYADTSAGKLTTAHIKVREAMEKVGAITDKIVQAVMPALADAFDDIVTAIGPLLDQIGEQMPGIMAAAGKAMDWVRVNVLPPLSRAFDWIVKNVIPALVKGFDWIVKNVLPAMGKAFAWIEKNVLPPVMAILKVLAEQVLPALSQAMDWIVTNVLPPVVAGFQWISDNVMPKVGAVIDWIVTNVLPPLNAALDWIGKNVLPALGRAAQGAVTVISTQFDILKSAIGVVMTVFDGLKTGIGAIWGGITLVVKTAINGIIGYVNMLIAALNAIQLHLHFSIPNPLGGTLASANFDWAGFGIAKIPTLHQGGIVPGVPGSDVLAMLQAGERVTSRADMAKGGGQPISIVVHNPTPERASDSIQNTLLRLAATGYLQRAI